MEPRFQEPTNAHREVPFMVPALDHMLKFMELRTEFMKLLRGPITVDMELAFCEEEYSSVRQASSSRFMKEHKELTEPVKPLEGLDWAFSEKMSYHFVMQHGLYVQQQLKLYHEQKKAMNREPQQLQELSVASPTEEDSVTERPRKIAKIALAKPERRLACAVCKHRRGKCKEDCEYARFFSQADTWKFLMLDKVYGMPIVMRLLRKYDGHGQQEAFEDLVLYTEMHMQHPIYNADRLLIAKAKQKTFPGESSGAGASSRAAQGHPLVRGHAPFEGQHLVGGYAPQQVFGRQQLVGGNSYAQLFWGQQLVGGYNAPQQQLVRGYNAPQQQLVGSYGPP